MPYDIIEEAAPESGGFEILEEQETPGELSGIVNSFRRGNLAAQRAIEAVQMTPETGPTFRQGRRGFVQAMEDPEYLNRLMMAGDDADAMRKAESLYGPGRRVQAMTDPQRQANIATAENISDLSRRADAIPQSAAMQEWAKADNSNWWQVFARNPVEITANIFAESLPQAAPTMAATMATGGMGRFAAAGAGGAGSFGMEAANSLVDAAASQGVDLHDPEQVRAFFADENKVKAAREFAMQRGLPIGLLDALTVGVAGKFLKPALGKGAARVAGATAAEAGAQMAGGAGGEALAQVASGQDLNVRDIAAEAIGELATAPGEVVGNLRAENRNRGFEVIEEGAGDKLKVPSSKPATSNLKPEPVSTPTVEDLKALEAAMRGNQLKPKEETASTTKPTAKAADIALDDLPEAAQEQLTRRMTAPPAEPEPVLRPLPPKSVEFKPTEEMRAAMEFQKRTDEAVRAALENPDKNYDAMTRQELEMLDSLGDAQAKAALRRGMFQGANVGSASANVGSPSANVGSLVANVEPAPLQPENRSVTEKPKSELPAETDAARVRREAKEFDKLLLDYGMEAGWVRAPEVLYDETASVQTGHGTASIKAKILRSKEMAGVRRRAAQELGALDAADMGDAKKRAALLPKLRELVEQRFAGPRKQAEAFSQATTAGKVPVPIGELKVGDTLNIEGDLVRVVEVSPDGEVTLQDGTRFGRQVMQDGSTIYAEEWQSEPAEPGAGFEAVEEPAQPAVKESLTVEQKAAEEVKAPTGSTSDLEIARDLLRRERKLSSAILQRFGKLPYPRAQAALTALEANNEIVRGKSGAFLPTGKPAPLQPATLPTLKSGQAQGDLLGSGDVEFNLYAERTGDGEREAAARQQAEQTKQAAKEFEAKNQMELAGTANVQSVDAADNVGGVSEENDYRMSHRPRDDGPRVFNLLENDIAPRDIYDHPEWYTGEPGSKSFRESVRALRAVRGKPDAPLKVYRAAPKKALNRGDWIALSKTYAAQHGMADDSRNDVPVHEFTVPASAVRWAGDSIEEYGYYPETDAIESALDKLKIETPPGSLQAFGLLPATWNQLIEIVRAAYRAGKTAAQAIRAGMDWLQAQGVKDYDAAGIQAHFEKELATADKDKAVTLEDLQQRLERLELQIIRSRRKGTAQATRALLDERAKLQEEFNALRYGAEQEAQAVEQQPAAPIPTFTQSQLDSVSSATMDGAPTAESFWEGFKRFLRFFATNTPEIAVTGPEAERASLFRRGVRLFGVETNNARRTAAREINKVLEPLKALGRDVTNPDAVDKFFALGKRIKREEARANPNEEKLATLREQQQAVREKLEGNPWYLFQQAVLWRDLWYRAKFLKTPSGGEITLPGGLELDQVESAMARNKELIDANPHAAAIRDSLKRHYKLMGDLQESLLQHGELIPDELRNPLYFPHHLLEKFTGKLDRARPTTEKDFRAYLIAPVGSEKLIEAGYLNALYKHVNDVTVHNARADVVEKYWRPYDEAAKRQKEIEADAAERGEEDVHPDAWKRNLPPGMELFTPSEEIPMRADYILNRGELAKALGVALPANGDLRGVLAQTGADIRLTGDMIQKAMVAGERPQWLLPSEIAEAIRGVVRREQAKTADTVGRRIGRVLAKPIQLWKGNTLFNWYNYPRYEWGNTITDVIDKMLGADPGMARYLGRALKEVRDAANGERTAEIDAAEREGVLQTVTAQEVGELAKLPEFEDFLTSKQWRMEKVRKFVTWTARASQLRESTFRYAKFLADLERIRRGEQPVYAGAYWRDVQAAKTPEAKAAEITLKTFGDYGNLSVVGNFLREHVIPFWSWQEINLSYHANLFRNLRDMLTLPAEERPGSVRDAARAAAVSTATFTGRAAIGIALRLALMRLAVEMWNQFGGAWAGLWDEDDDLEGQLSEADRRRFHLLLGKDEQGRARVVYVPNALSDVAEWFGGNNFARLFTEWAKGDIPFGQFVGDFAKQAPTDLVNKVVQGARPDAKFAYMAVSGKDPFPDVTDQRDISRENLGWMLMQTVTDRDAATFLRSQLDKDFYAPEGLSEWLGRKLLQVRRRDPEQWAYYEIRDKAADWKEARTGKRNEGFDYQSPDQQVIRNFRKAIYRGDLDNAVRFYNRLRDYGYTNQRFAASIRNSDPLSDLTKLERREFEQGLTQYERELLARARRYYGRLSASKGRERALFPSNPRSTARPSEERIKTLLAPRE